MNISDYSTISRVFSFSERKMYYLHSAEQIELDKAPAVLLKISESVQDKKIKTVLAENPETREKYYEPINDDFFDIPLESPTKKSQLPRFKNLLIEGKYLSYDKFLSSLSITPTQENINFLQSVIDHLVSVTQYVEQVRRVREEKINTSVTEIIPKIYEKLEEIKPYLKMLSLI